MVRERENAPDVDTRASAEARRRERAIAAVIATNALISPEQFEALRDALGREVVMEFHRLYTVAECDGGETEYPEDSSKSFILKDVNFVRHPNTQEVYLAFFSEGRQGKRDSTYYPYWEKAADWGDKEEFIMNCLKLPSGEILWRFDKPQSKQTDILGPGRDQYVGTETDSHIFGDILTHSESMKALEKS